MFQKDHYIHTDLRLESPRSLFLDALFQACRHSARTPDAELSYTKDLRFVGEDDISTVGGKAANLGILIRAGLTVPPGMAVTTAAYDEFLRTKTVPAELVRHIKEIKRRLGGKVAIRSSANVEDGTNLSMAGVFESHYVTDDAKIEEAISKIYAQTFSPEALSYFAIHGIDPNEVKMGLVVQELIEPSFSGVIYAEEDESRLLIQYVDGFGTSLVDGQTHGSAVCVDMTSGRITQSVGYERRPLPDGFLKEILRQVKVITRIFAHEAHDIEFAYRDGIIYILQARALTTSLGEVALEETPQETLAATKEQLHAIVDKEKKELGTKTVVFTDSNLNELLPRPTQMDFGVFRFIFTGHDGIPGAIQIGRREMGYPLGDESIGLMHFIGGRPYASVARDAATFYAGFPEDSDEYFEVLVNEYLSDITKDPSKGSYPEMHLYLQDPTRADLERRFGAKKGRKYYEKYQCFLARMKREADDFKDGFRHKEEGEIKSFIKNMANVKLERLSTPDLVRHLKKILEHLRTVSCVAFVKSARLGFYYSQRMLSSLRSQFGFSEQDANEMFAKLSQGLEGSLITEMNIAIASASSVEQALRIAEESIGHFSTREMLEIRHPRLKDDPAALRAYVEGIRTGNYAEAFRAQMEERKRVEHDLLSRLPEDERADFAHTIGSAQTYMALRESIKYYFTQEYSLLKDAFEELGRRLGLPEGDIYFVYPEEVETLTYDPAAMGHIIRSRKQIFQNNAEIDLPSVIREGDIDGLALATEGDESFTELRGKFLAEGPEPIVRGVVVNVDEFETIEEVTRRMNGFTAQGKSVILVATQLTLVHDSLINMAAGLVVANAGIVSHVAQRARELQKSAIGGIRTKYLKTGMLVELDMKELTVRKI